MSLVPLVGDFVNGPVMIHDGIFDSYSVQAQLPIGDTNGYFRGMFEISPFYYNGIDNETYANKVFVEFDLALQADHTV